MKRIKKKTHEKLSDSNIKHVISLLEASPSITKKEACDILNIAYNTTRLKKIIEEYQSDKEYRDKRKAEKRGKPATKDEIALVISSYLDGEPIQDIAKRVYRSAGFISAIIERTGVPTRVFGEEKLATELLPEACISEEFAIGEIAWSATHHAACEIRSILGDKYIKDYSVNCYKIWVKEDSDEYSQKDQAGFNAYAPAYDLGKLTHLEEFGVNISKL